METLLLALMLALAPTAPRDRLAPIARAITEAKPSNDEALALVTLSYYETTFGRAGVPYGLSCCRRHPTADRALAIWRVSRACGAAPAVRFGYYQSGRCVINAYGLRGARLLRRLRNAQVSVRIRGT